MDNIELILYVLLQVQQLIVQNRHAKQHIIFHVLEKLAVCSSKITEFFVLNIQIQKLA